MREHILDEFIQYAKEHFGYEISVEKVAEPDSFERIFGASFLNQDTNFYMPEGDEIRFEYVNCDVLVSLDFSKVMTDFYSVYEIGLAA